MDVEVEVEVEVELEAEPSRRTEEARRRFERLTAPHRSALLDVALRCCSRDLAVADDMVQDAYVRAWRRFDLLLDESKVVPWLVTILRNCWIDACRKPTRVVPMAEVPDQLPPVDEASRWEQVTVEDLHCAIHALDEPFRSAAIRRYVDQQTLPEIARQSGVPYATVATRLHRARKLLLEALSVTFAYPEND